MTDEKRRAAAIAAAHGCPSAPVTAPQWPGVDNHVLVVGAGADRHVVRFPREGRPADHFDVEVWCIDGARSAGVPSPEVVAHGLWEGEPFMVQRLVEGTTGALVRDLSLWRRLGEYARLVADVPVDDAPDQLFSRFGRDLAEAWRRHVGYNLDALTDDDPLVALGVYPAQQRGELRSLLAGLLDTPLHVGLCHGDLALRNLVVPDAAVVEGEEGARAGLPVLIDWGAATTGPVPFTDLLSLLRNHGEHDDPSSEELEAFLDGFGSDLVDPAMVPATLQAVQVLSALDLVRWARERRPDLLDEYVERARSLLRR